MESNRHRRRETKNRSLEEICVHIKEELNGKGTSDARGGGNREKGYSELTSVGGTVAGSSDFGTRATPGRAWFRGISTLLWVPRSLLKSESEVFRATSPEANPLAPEMAVRPSSFLALCIVADIDYINRARNNPTSPQGAREQARDDDRPFWDVAGRFD